MKVFLLETIKNVGIKNHVVDVKDGYAKNFLIPKKLAVFYSEKTKKQIEKKQLNFQNQNEYQIVQLNLLKQTIEKLNLVFFLKTANDKEFGKVTHLQILEKLKEYKIDLTKHAFNDKHHYGIGEHKIKLILSPKVMAILLINVKPENY